MLVNQHCLIGLLGYFIINWIFLFCFTFVHQARVFTCRKSYLGFVVFSSCIVYYIFQGNKAIVVDEPGVTRDRLYGRSVWGLHEFMVVDTGGVLSIAKSQTDVMEELAITTTIGMEGIPLNTREAAVARMPSMIEKQAIVAVEEASVVLFLVDGQVWYINCRLSERNKL